MRVDAGAAMGRAGAAPEEPGTMGAEAPIGASAAGAAGASTWRGAPGEATSPGAPAAHPSPALEVRGLTKRYRRGDRPALDNVWLDVQDGEILTLVGESGSGKTTLLRLVAGLEQADAGEIVLRGRTVCDERTFIPPEHRGASLVFQDYALFPHLTVEGNVGFGLRRLGRAERGQRVREMLELVGLRGLERRYPHELSGGQQQRVALARALAPRPAILLLDEPFSNLDRALKARLRQEVAALIRATGTTAVFVVHDPDDALAIGDRIAVLRDGRLVQLGKPREILDSPCGPYVAGFFGIGEPADELEP
jgi:iron(III) transport system ATP-binding protein